MSFNDLHFTLRFQYNKVAWMQHQILIDSCRKMDDLYGFFDTFLFRDMHKGSFSTKGGIECCKRVFRIGNSVKILLNDFSEFGLTKRCRKQAYIYSFMRGFGEKRTIYPVDKNNFVGINIVEYKSLYVC